MLSCICIPSIRVFFSESYFDTRIQQQRSATLTGNPWKSYGGTVDKRIQQQRSANGTGYPRNSYGGIADKPQRQQRSANGTGYPQKSNGGIAPPDQRALACIAVPVGPSHHLEFSKLIALVNELLVDRPSVYAVFDEDGEQEKFCQKYKHACSDGSFQFLSFRRLVGDSVYLQSYNTTFRHAKPDIFPRDRTCPKRSEGRVWQAMKKFYGVAALDGLCSTVLLMDAESFPFRRHNFTERMLFYVKRNAFQVSLWYPDAHGCTYKHGETVGHEEDCDLQVAKALRMEDFVGYQPSASSESLKAYFNQQYTLEQFWPYYPSVAKRILEFGEHQLGGPFALEFPRFRLADVTWYLVHFLHWAAEAGTNLSVINLVDELQGHFPQAWSTCCRCRKNPDLEYYWYRRTKLQNFEPCRSISMMGSTCMRKAVNMSELGRWFVEHLGVFGAQSYVMETIPPSFLAGDGQFYWSWCVNNCQTREVIANLAKVPGVNRSLLERVVLR